jgi:hypothetical protein
MSFKTFIYYCALCGAWAAFLAGVLVLALGLEDYAMVTGATLGMCLGLGVGMVDAVLNSSTAGERSTRVLVCLVIGLAGGFLSGLIGDLLVLPLGEAIKFRFLGWTLVGITIGAAVGAFDTLRALNNQQGAGQSLRKVINGVVGGTLGGLVGGVLYDLLDLTGLKGLVPRTSLALGLVILGGCIGLLIGLAQVILKEAWVKVEQGFRAGRELILSKPETTIGRAEGSDIGLFSDNQVEKLHARIVLRNNRYLLEDAGTASGTFLNGSRLDGPALLRAGDAIQVGKSVLRFDERQKRNGKR